MDSAAVSARYPITAMNQKLPNSIGITIASPRAKTNVLLMAREHTGRV